MTFQGKIATVFGGTGFVGRQVVRELASLGYQVKVATRVPERAFFLRPAGVVGQVVPIACRISDPASIAEAVRGADVVVNCIGILYEKGKNQTFQKIHAELPGRIAAACAQNGVKRFVHISALGIEESKAKYAKTKLEGEQAVLSNFPKATILRPSVIFGADDEFFNMFARLSQVMPFLPLIGGGRTKFQPVYVGDVADAVKSALTFPATNAQNPQGKIYALGGPEVVNFKEIYNRLFQYTGLRRRFLPLSFGAAKVQASFMRILPKPPLTPDQVESLKTDNIVPEGAAGFAALGITPVAMDSVLPGYLETYRRGGRFSKIRLV